MKKNILSKGLGYVPTVSNLTDDYLITNPSDYIKTFRNTFLELVRETQNLSKEEVAKDCGLSVKELERIESGNATEADLMILQKLSKIYALSYPHLLALFKLVKRQQKDYDLKLAAHHDLNIDKDTMAKITDFIIKLKGEKQGKNKDNE
jgi:transcriptional regulator with XRE-family HTH domain